MNRAHYLFIGLVFFLSCTEEDQISTRDYPFIESMSAQSSEGGGATVEFEIIKAGKNPITNYGVEYAEGLVDIEPGKWRYEKVDISGTPNNAKVVVDIQYELDEDKYYTLRPFVKTANQVVYGAEMTFLSKGTRPPIINEISVSGLSGNTEFVIKGDYFSQNKNLNKVEILGLERYYYVEIIRSTNTELKLRAIKGGDILPVTDEKFALKVTSRGKSIIIPQHFSIQFPQILGMSPTRGHVGSTFTIEIDPLTFRENEFYLTTSFATTTPSSVLGIINGVVKNINAGSYQVKLNGTGYDHFHIYHREFEVLNSWKLYRGNPGQTQISEFLTRYNFGDNIINFSLGENASVYLQDKLTGTYTNLSDFPEMKKRRFNFLSATFQNRYLYFGLGFQFTGNNNEWLQDFYKLDAVTNEWKRMSDFPFDWLSAGFGFEYQGNLVFVTSHPNFLFYDPLSDTWSDSQIPVPLEFKNKHGYTVYENQIYFYLGYPGLNGIFKFRIGEEPTLFSQINPTFGDMGFETKRLLVHNNSLYFNSGNKVIAKIDLSTGISRQIQTINFNNVSYDPMDLFPFIRNEKYFLGYPNNSWEIRDIVYELDLDD
ncbi:hypothetical protein [Aquiflexum sp.]|uniref:hypothetical protein n=1 Tax=Aquiflexum sp. TaxID=1872584 RepID=UPI0035948693